MRAWRGLLVVLLACRREAEANTIGQSVPTEPSETGWFRIEDLTTSIAQVLNDARSHVRREAVDVDVDRIERELRDMFTALPKNRRGSLDHATARYALHRYFLWRHAMYIRGLDPSQDRRGNDSSIILDDEVPTVIQSMFEERLHDGFDLSELAIMAAALEHVVHKEAIHGLIEAFADANFSIHDKLTLDQLDIIMDTFLTTLLGSSEDQEPATLQSVPTSAQRFMRIAQANITEHMLGSDVDRSAPVVGFTFAVRVLAFFTEAFGSWHNLDCQAMSEELAKHEVQGSGRVRLAEFYQAGWRYKEAKDYLLSIGAAEEISHAGGRKDVRVIIPNYISGKANCFASTEVYQICCTDRCESLFGTLEREVAAPTARAGVIADIVSRLPSPTVHAPRQLSDSLLLRLDGIAQAHGGSIPLHGRLFAQWMHYAFPRECPFPQISGQLKPMVAADWMNATKTRAALTQEEVDAFVQDATQKMAEMRTKDLVDSDWESTLPWSNQEELPFARPRKTLTQELRLVGRAVASFALLAATINVLASVLRSAMGAIDGPKLQKE